jgi:hypothetical protein
MDESQRETPALLIRRKCCGNWRLSATLCQAASVKKNYIGSGDGRLSQGWSRTLNTLGRKLARPVLFYHIISRAHPAMQD